MVTSRDVARVAGVSQATVSRVMSSHPNVADATRARVLEAMEQTGYVPNAAARTMRTHRTGTIGVVVQRITNPFYPEVLECLAAELDAAGLRMILWNAAIGSGEDAAIDSIQRRLVDGIIFTTATTESASLRAAIDLTAPVVLMNRTVQEFECDQVDSDNEAASGVVARYFAANGHQTVAHIPGPQDASTGRDRRAGFVRAAEESSLDVITPESSVRQFSHELGYMCMKQVLSSGKEPPTAVFCGNDITAIGALDCARSLGVRVPDELWVVGFDDIAMASWESYKLTTSRQPVSAMCKASVELLVARLEDRSRSAVHVRYSNELIVRASTGNVPHGT